MLFVRQLKGNEAPLWPHESDAGQGTFPLITLALSSTFLQDQTLFLYFLTSDQSGIHCAIFFLTKLVHACFWSHSTTRHVPQQWSNRANADFGVQQWISVPTCSLYSSLLKLPTQHSLWHTLRGHGISAPCRDFFEIENKSMCVWVHFFLCAEAATRDRLVKIYITKHPQVCREISKIQIEAETIKEWFQDVRGGERKEGEEKEEGWKGFWKPPWLHTVRAWPEKEPCFSRMKGWQCCKFKVFTHSLEYHKKWVSMMFAAKFNIGGRGGWFGLPTVMCFN